MAVAAKDKKDKDFDSLNLRGVNLSRLDLTSANFRNANLRRADLSAATLDWADFTDADLTGANLTEAQLKKANFTDADLSHADLRNSQLRGAILERACLQGAYLKGADLTDVYIRNWKISPSKRCQGISFPLYKNPEQTDNKISDRQQLDDEIDRSQQQWKQIDKALDELYELKGMTGREAWGEQFSEKAKELELPLQIVNHLFQKYYERRLFRESRRSLRIYLLRDWQFLKLEHWLESLNYSIAHWDIFPILDKLQTLSIIGALVLLINGLIRVDYESRYRAWEIINTDERHKIDGGTRLGLERLVKEGASLKNLQASGANLTGINLRNANLQRANLRDTNLRNSDMRNANLRNADLRDADLRDAKLRGVDFARVLYDADTQVDGRWKDALRKSGIKIGPGENLSKKDLSGRDLSEADLTGAELTGAELTGAELTGADLTGADLTGADLTGADLTEAELTEADLTEANITGVLHDKDTQVDGRWKNALRKSGIKIGPGENLSEKDLSGKDLSQADLTEANLTKANLTGADLTEANLTEADLTGADLTGAEVKNALFGHNLGISESMKLDLIRRGAIFVDSPDDPNN